MEAKKKGDVVSIPLPWWMFDATTKKLKAGYMGGYWSMPSPIEPDYPSDWTSYVGMALKHRIDNNDSRLHRMSNCCNHPTHSSHCNVVESLEYSNVSTNDSPDSERDDDEPSSE